MLYFMFLWRTLSFLFWSTSAAAKLLQSCPTLCDPIDGSPPGSSVPGKNTVSRQEHWSRLPFPSPMQESEKWKWSCSVMSASLRPHGLQLTRLPRPWDFPGKSTGVVCHRLLHLFWSSRQLTLISCEVHSSWNLFSVPLTSTHRLSPGAALKLL